MDLKLLQNSLLFNSMSEDELSACLEALGALEKSFSKNEILFRAGDLTDCMGLVLSGSITIESNDVWGNCTILSHVGSGQFFAETYALLPGERMLVDVRANEDCTILFLNVGRLLLNSSEISWQKKLICNLLGISAHKNLTLSERSFHTSPKSARGRILAYLNTVSLQMQSAEFDIPFDRQQLADYLNLERTNMSKELGKMQKDGIIEYRKNHFRLIKKSEY